jgi:hypothetical protein
LAEERVIHLEQAGERYSALRRVAKNVSCRSKEKDEEDKRGVGVMGRWGGGGGLSYLVGEDDY